MGDLIVLSYCRCRVFYEQYSRTVRNNVLEQNLEYGKISKRNTRFSHLSNSDNLRVNIDWMPGERKLNLSRVEEDWLWSMTSLLLGTWVLQQTRDEVPEWIPSQISLSKVKLSRSICCSYKIFLLLHHVMREQKYLHKVLIVVKLCVHFCV